MWLVSTSRHSIVNLDRCSSVWVDYSTLIVSSHDEETDLRYDYSSHDAALGALDHIIEALHRDCNICLL